MGRSKVTSIDRFWQQLNKKEDGCWEWTGGLYSNGYGQHWHAGRLWRTHRLAYTLVKGPIPTGLCVLHACDNRRCCNPDHLHLGTNADNQQEMDDRGRRRSRARSLTPGQIEQIRAEYYPWKHGLAEKYGVSNKTIQRAVKGHR